MAHSTRGWTGARTPSGKKRVRQAERREAINAPRKSRAKTLVAKTLKIATGAAEGEALLSLAEAYAALDKAAKTGAIHPNTAQRRKSRLALKVNAALAGETRPDERPCRPRRPAPPPPPRPPRPASRPARPRRQRAHRRPPARPRPPSRAPAVPRRTGNQGSRPQGDRRGNAGEGHPHPRGEARREAAAPKKTTAKAAASKATTKATTKAAPKAAAEGSRQEGTGEGRRREGACQEGPREEEGRVALRSSRGTVRPRETPGPFNSPGAAAVARAYRRPWSRGTGGAPRGTTARASR